MRKDGRRHAELVHYNPAHDKHACHQRSSFIDFAVHQPAHFVMLPSTVWVK
jgi:hypothetical protein